MKIENASVSGSKIEPRDSPSEQNQHPTDQIVIVGYPATDQIFPFSENGPASYNFSLFSKLPTSYPKIRRNIKSVRKYTVVYFGVMFFLTFGGNLWVNLKTMKNYNLQANFQKMEKSGL